MTVTDLKKKLKNGEKLRRRILVVLAAIAVFCTTYALIIPAITWERTLICELQEHTHGSGCYDADGQLTCALPEHIHDASCFDAPPSSDPGYICGMVAHTHNELCYYPNGELRCTIPEHTHTLSCRRLLSAVRSVDSTPVSQPSVLLVTGSDFQDPHTSYSQFGTRVDYSYQTTRISTIMGRIMTEYGTKASQYAFVAGGDYQFDSATTESTNKTRTTTGINAVKGAVQTYLGTGADYVFVEGNHDSIVDGIASTGAHDADGYGLYVINEDNFESKPSSSTATSASASALRSYLQTKADAGYDKPIFVATHVSLHYSTRTAKEKDAAYSYLLYNVLKDYGDDLNIIFLYGHDHAWGDDDYLGGSAVFLKKGDTMWVAGNSVDADGNVVPYSTLSNNYQHKVEVPLNFTYVNYGYTGYYWSRWVNSLTSTPGNADSTLTMTSFLITGNSVEICRWDENGRHVLKANGAACAGGRGIAEVCPVTTTTYPSPMTVSFTPTGGGTDTPSEPVNQTFTDIATGITVKATGTAVSADIVEQVPALENAGVTNYTAYEIEVADFDSSTPAIVSLPAAAGYNTVWYVNGNSLEIVDGAEFRDGRAVFETNHFSTWAVGELPEIPSSGMAEGDYWVRCTATDDITAGDATRYIIASGNTAFGVSGSGTSASVSTTTITPTEAGKVNGVSYFTITGTGFGDAYQWRYNNRQLYNVGGARYLRLGRSDTNLLGTAANIAIESAGSSLFRIRNTESNSRNRRYLQYSGNTFSRTSSNSTGSATNMTFYRKVHYTPPANLLVLNSLEGTSDLADSASFTYRLTSGNSYGAARAVGNKQYTLYNSNNTVVAGTHTTSADGVFVLGPGQYAVFEDMDTAATYYVRLNKEEFTTGIDAKVNGVAVTPTVAGDSSHVPVSVSSGNTATVQMISHVEDPRYPLTVTLDITGSNSAARSFSVKLLNADGTPAVFESCILWNGDRRISDYLYEEIGDDGILLSDGYSIEYTGLANGSYKVVESLGDSVSYSNSATVGGSAATGTMSGGDFTVPITYQGGRSSDTVLYNMLPYIVTFDYGDGTTASTTVTTDENGHLTGTMPTPTRDGYTFAEWGTKPNRMGVRIDGTNYNTYTFTKDTTLYAQWNKNGSVEVRDAGLTKSIRQSTAYEKGTENLFDIDLTADLPSANSDQAVVMVLDLSSSMTTFCAVCGDTSHSSGKTSTSTSNNVWSGSGTVTETFPSHNFANRLTLMKAAAKDFISQLQELVDDGNVEHCYVSIIGFWTDDQKYADKVDLADPNSLDALLNTIDGLDGHSGTNLSLGMKDAYGELQNVISVKNVNPSNSYVVLLSDGIPTTNTDRVNNVYKYQAGFDDPGTIYYVPDEAVSDDYVSRWMNIWSHYDHFDPHYDGYSTSASGAKLFHMKAILGPAYYADQIRNLGSHTYSVSFGHNKDYNTWQSANSYKYVSLAGIDNADYIASFSDVSANANTGTQQEIAQQLADFYSTTVQALKVSCANGIVTDPMSENVEFLGFEDESGNLQGYTYHGATYNPTTRTITWSTDDYQKLTYRVRLKNETAGFQNWTNYDTEYLTNGTTTLTYDVYIDNVLDHHGTVNADLPYVHGWLGDLQFVKTGGLIEGPSARPLTGVKFTLHHDPTTCPICRNLPQADRAVIPDMEDISDSNGIVFFGIPSGHTYLMTEEEPSGFAADSAGYTVKVEFGKVTVTANGTGHWTDEEDGQMARLFNPKDANREMPSTGGSGIVLLYTLGGLLTAGAIVCGYALRRRRERRMG